jgi:2,4-dienoyl-CoA reductase-like NADH-dependent reductase (Old Yellow Enzyme family)
MNLFTEHNYLGLRNRAVMAPLTRFSYDSGGFPSQKLAEYYIRRAEFGVGLIIVESCAVNSREANGYVNGASFFSEIHAQAWKPIVKQVHDNGAKIWIQLFHAGRLTVPEICHSVPVSASPIVPNDYPSFWRPKVGNEVLNFQTLTPYIRPKELNHVEIEKVISDFQNAVYLAETAGFDGVELHGAHGYLIHSFLSSSTNKRGDEYSLDTGYKFIEDLVASCRKVIQPKTILSFRCSVHMVDNPLIRFSMNEINFDKIINILNRGGIDVFHSSQIDSKRPLFGSNLTLHQIIRSNTTKPIIICGGIQTLKDANTILETDPNALIAFGRNFVSNPDLVRLLQTERETEIIKFDYSKHINTIF